LKTEGDERRFIGKMLNRCTIAYFLYSQNTISINDEINPDMSVFEINYTQCRGPDVIVFDLKIGMMRSSETNLLLPSEI
jgi:hypothetical protein